MMLNTLKGKFLSSSRSQDELANTTNLSPERINAGAQILKHFQGQWSDLHALNENNAKNLRVTAATTKQIYDQTEKQKKNVAVLNEWILSLPYLNKSLNHCAECLSEMYIISDKVERALYVLEDLVEEIEFNCKDMEQQTLEKITAEKLRLETLEEQSGHGEVDNKTLKEKQKFFEEAFQSDLENYKKLGTTVLENRKPDVDSVSLEEIQIESNTKELEDFLNDDP